VVKSRGRVGSCRSIYVTSLSGAIDTVARRSSSAIGQNRRRHRRPSVSPAIDCRLAERTNGRREGRVVCVQATFCVPQRRLKPWRQSPAVHTRARSDYMMPLNRADVARIVSLWRCRLSIIALSQDTAPLRLAASTQYLYSASLATLSWTVFNDYILRPPWRIPHYGLHPVFVCNVPAARSRRKPTLKITENYTQNINLLSHVQFTAYFIFLCCNWRVCSSSDVAIMEW